jgi:hypothetical protein
MCPFPGVSPVSACCIAKSPLCTPCCHADGLLQRLLADGDISPADVASGVHSLHPAFLASSLERSLGEPACLPELNTGMSWESALPRAGCAHGVDAPKT